jgi:hypothetical protein
MGAGLLHGQPAAQSGTPHTVPACNLTRIYAAGSEPAGTCPPGAVSRSVLCRQNLHTPPQRCLPRQCWWLSLTPSSPAGAWLVPSGAGCNTVHHTRLVLLPCGTLGVFTCDCLSIHLSASCLGPRQGLPVPHPLQPAGASSLCLRHLSLHGGGSVQTPAAIVPGCSCGYRRV